ncbi:MAG: TFIIB-type zinc ribbon-containing protein, partial [Candidatus Wukongarchaeota archaeon]|nr:TFIIB-type zinc ribbon-containing protein [Candidatus Wukongarchaeota archaeon]
MAKGSESERLEGNSAGKKVCPECGSDSFIQDETRAEVCCGNCGLIL